MTKIVTPVLTEKDVTVMETILKNSAVHMTPVKKREVTAVVNKLKKAQRTVVT